MTTITILDEWGDPDQTPTTESRRRDLAREIGAISADNWESFVASFAPLNNWSVNHGKILDGTADQIATAFADLASKKFAAARVQASHVAQHAAIFAEQMRDHHLEKAAAHMGMMVHETWGSSSP